MPTLMPAPRTPETVGRDAVGQHSATSATPLGHMPPTPRPDQEPQHEHLFAAGDERAEPGEERVEQDAHAHRPGAADAVAEIAE